MSGGGWSVVARWRACRRAVVVGIELAVLLALAFAGLLAALFMIRSESRKAIRSASRRIDIARIQAGACRRADCDRFGEAKRSIHWRSNGRGRQEILSHPLRSLDALSP